MGGSFLSPDDTSPRSYDRGLVPVGVVKEREKWEVFGFVSYFLSTVLSYLEFKAKSCISCERFVNSPESLRGKDDTLPLTHPRPVWNNIGYIFLL